MVPEHTVRIQSVDVFRVLALLAVIALHMARHTGPDAVGTRFDGAALFDQAERFAVPLFFMLSGFFWAAKWRAPAAAWPAALALARRAMFLFVVWSAVYFVADVIEWVIATGAVLPAVRAAAGRHDTLTTLLFQGTKVHLWFLPALACAALASGAMLSRGWERPLFLLALLLFAIGLAGKAYAGTPLGFPARFNLRNGPFFSLLMFATGYALQRRGPHPGWAAAGALLALGGLALQCAELAWLQRHWGASLAQDFVVGTYPYGLGVAMLALSDARPLRVPGLAAVGPRVLGMYASHYLFIDALQAATGARIGPAAWQAGGVAVVFVLSLALTLALSALPLARRAVS
jgi:surface polysaccharide O-acyltransferase-like enzyme